MRGICEPPLSSVQGTVFFRMDAKILYQPGTRRLKTENLMSHPEGHQAGTWPNGKCKAIAQGHASQTKLLHFPFRDFKSGAFMLLLCCVFIRKKKKSSFEHILHSPSFSPISSVLPKGICQIRYVGKITVMCMYPYTLDCFQLTNSEHLKKST